MNDSLIQIEVNCNSAKKLLKRIREQVNNEPGFQPEEVGELSNVLDSLIESVDNFRKAINIRRVSRI
jgi:hypothetical protein